jgi:hypothetical protein
VDHELRVQRTFRPGQTIFHTRRDTVDLDVRAGAELDFLTLTVQDRQADQPLMMGLSAEQVLIFYHRLGDWLVQSSGLTTESSESSR